MFDITIGHILVLQLLVFGASVAVGITSFGFAMIMSPLFLLFLEPRLVVELNVVLFTVLVAIVALQSWRYMDKGTVLVLLLAAVAAMPLGVLALSAMDGRTLRLVLIAAVIAQVAIAMVRRHRPFHREKLAAIPVGALVGFLATALALGGAVMVLFALNQGWGRDRTRANLSGVFSGTGPAVLVFHGFAGLFGVEELKISFLFLPALLIGVFLASRLISRVNERLFRYAILTVLLGTSFGILGRELVQILL